MIEGGQDQDPIPYARSVCGGCGFNRVCYPPKSFGEGAAYLDNPTLVALLERREHLAPGASEYRHVDEEAKATLKHEGVKSAIVGPFQVEGKPRADGAIVYDIRRLPSAVSS